MIFWREWGAKILLSYMIYSVFFLPPTLLRKFCGLLTMHCLNFIALILECSLLLWYFHVLLSYCEFTALQCDAPTFFLRFISVYNRQRDQFINHFDALSVPIIKFRPFFLVIFPHEYRLQSSKISAIKLKYCENLKKISHIFWRLLNKGAFFNYIDKTR